jgi:hypothetical protein
MQTELTGRPVTGFSTRVVVDHGDVSWLSM